MALAVKMPKIVDNSENYFRRLILDPLTTFERLI